MIAVKCPHCHVGLKVAEGKIPLGITSFKCPKCKEPIPLSLLSEKSNHQEVDSDTILVTPVKTGIGRLTVLPDADTPELAFPLHEGKVVIGRKSNASQATMPIITADRTIISFLLYSCLDPSFFLTVKYNSRKFMTQE